MFRDAIRLARPAALLAIAAVAVACVGSAGAAGSTPSPKPVDPDKVIFRVSWDGGFVTPETLLGRVPMGVVYADGRVITQGPVLAIYPGPLMPNLQERTLSPEALDRLIALAREQDLLKDVRYDFPGIADAADTVLEINLDGKSYRLNAYALAEAGMEGEIAPAVGVTPADKAGRTAMREFIDALLAVPETDYVDQPHAYEFESLRLYVKPAEIVENSEFPGEQPPIAWPLDDLATAGTLIDNPSVDRCLVVHGDDLATVLPLLQGANQLSVFESGTEVYSLVPRPLYPDENGPLNRLVPRVKRCRVLEVRLAGRRPTMLPSHDGRERDRATASGHAGGSEPTRASPAAMTTRATTRPIRIVPEIRQ